MTSTQRTRDALNRTFDWFLQNPDRHMTGRMSNSNSECYNPFAKDATCFCFLGRFAVEYGPVELDEGSLHGWAEAEHAELPTSAIYGINDSSHRPLAQRLAIIKELTR